MVMIHSFGGSTGYKRKRTPVWSRTKKVRYARTQASRYRSMNKRLGGFAGRELRFVDYQLAETVLSPQVPAGIKDPATALALNAIAQGSGNNQRGGLRATIMSCQVKGVVVFPKVSTQGIVKIYMVLDTQTNGAAMTADEFLVDPTDDVHGVSAFINLENTHRFKTLAQTTATYVTQNHFGSSESSADLAPTIHVPFNLYKGWSSGMITRFLSTGATISDIADNSIHIVAICGQGPANATSASIAYQTRIRYQAN